MSDSSSAHRFKAGFIQFDVKLGQTDDNLKTAAGYIRQMAEKNVRLAVLPEMWSCGFDNSHLAEHARKTPELLDRLAELASAHQMVICGSMPESDDGKIYNTLYVTEPDGTLAGKYRKVHLFSVTHEDHFFSAGNENVVCNTSLGPVGLMICYDLRFPELCRSLALKGAKIVIAPAQWPTARIDRWDVLCRARAIENQLYFIGANRTGREGRNDFSGHSIIVEPSGEVLVWAKEGKAAIGVADIDFSVLESVRETVPNLRERVPGAYEQ